MSSEADGEKGFIELSGNEKLVSLNEMFPDKEILKYCLANFLQLSSLRLTHNNFSSF